MRSKASNGVEELAAVRQSPRSQKSQARTSISPPSKKSTPRKRAAESQLQDTSRKRVRSGKRNGLENEINPEETLSVEENLKIEEGTEIVVNGSHRANQKLEQNTPSREKSVKHSPKKTVSEKVVKKLETSSDEGEGGSKRPKRRRKTKEEKEAEAMPLAARTRGLKMFIGAHVSGAKGRNLNSIVAVSMAESP
jgi:AP endonuclease-1